MGACYMAWAEYGDKQGDIPESVPDSKSYLEEPDISVDIPDFYRAEPAVLEAVKIVQGISRAIPGRVVK